MHPEKGTLGANAASLTRQEKCPQVNQLGRELEKSRLLLYGTTEIKT